MPKSSAFHKTATDLMLGTASLSSASRLADSSLATSETPVTLPPGWARLEQANPHYLRDPARIVAIRLVDLLRRQQGLHVSRLHADHRQLDRRQRIDQPLRQRAGLDPDPAVAHAERVQ